MKRTAMDHPKLMLLRHRLGVDKPVTVGVLECLWHFTAQFTPDGRVGKYPPGLIAEKIGYGGDADFLFQALEDCGWIDQTDQGWVIHDWADHCDDAVHLRLARAGLRFADGRMPTLTRLNARERKTALARYQDQEGVRAHGVRPARAEARAEAQAHAGAEAESGLMVGSRRSADRHTDQPPDIPAQTARATVPVSAAALLPKLLDELQSRREDLPARILRATGEAAAYREWWRRVERLMQHHDGADTLHEALRHVEDCADPVVRALKDLGALRAPGAYLASRCRDHLAKHGVRLPPPPRPCHSERSAAQ